MRAIADSRLARSAIAGYPVAGSTRSRNREYRADDPRERQCMQDDRAVTIVIITYNHARYLAAAIESVLAQTVAATAIIVVDDGSKDDPASVVARFPGVRILSQVNQGPSAARNTGLHATTTRYVGFLDADDTLAPTMIEANLTLFDEQPDCSFVYGGYALTDDAGSVTSVPPMRWPGEDAYATFLRHNAVGMLGTVLFRTDRLLDVGGFDPTLRVSEDYAAFIQLARSHPVHATTEILAYYRRHGENTSNNIPMMLSIVISALEREREYASSRPEWTAALEEGLAHFRSYYLDTQFHQMRLAAGVPGAAGPAWKRMFEVLRMAPRAALPILFNRARNRLRTIARSLPVRRDPWRGLRRLTPVERFVREKDNTPIDRHYVQEFLAGEEHAVSGRVVVVGHRSHGHTFGTPSVIGADLLARTGVEGMEIEVDAIRSGSVPPPDSADAIVIAQALHLVPDPESVVEALHRALKPGGTLLVTVPFVAKIDRFDWGRTPHWSIAPGALRNLLCGPFSARSVEIRNYGSILTTIAFVRGASAQAMKAADLEANDPAFPVVVAAVARKEAHS
jgi:glycosyltransferase involved in cell wall biosynthesis